MSDPTNVPEGTPLNGPLFDAEGNLVKFKPTKAVIGGIIGFISLVATALSAIYTDNVVLTVILIVVGSLGTTLGIYQPANKPVKA